MTDFKDELKSILNETNSTDETVNAILALIQRNIPEAKSAKPICDKILPAVYVFEDSYTIGFKDCARQMLLRMGLSS